MNGAQSLVHALRAHAIDHIFGLPGDTGMAFYDALYHEPAITHIMTRDERSASFMADVYARVSGRIGVCEGPSGGGTTYIVPGVAEAQGSAIPLLCLTSDTPVGEEHRGVLTELDQVSLFRPITKWSERVNRASGMEDAVHRAVRLATSDRPGAAHLSLPSDVLEEDHGTAVRDAVVSRGVAPQSRPRADAREVQRAADLIARVRRPVIVAGGGVLTSQAWDELTTFAESTGIPVGTSINGKGSIAETSECSIGVVGGNGSPSYANEWIREADLVFFIGTRTDSTTTAAWTLPSRANPPVTIHLDMSSREIGNTYPTSVVLHGDARATLVDLLAAFGRVQTMREAATARLARLEADKHAYVDATQEAAGSDSRPIKPQRLVATLRRLLDDETIIVADPGTPTPYLAAQYQLRVAGRTTVIPRAHGGLGYAIPGVVGAHVAAPDKRTIGMLGDGSFGMSVGELETISRLNLPIVLIQCGNGSYGWIKQLQHLYHDQRYYSVDFTNLDYAAIARGFGLEGHHVTDPADLEPVLANALASGKPTFVNVVTEAQMTETPPVSSWEAAVASAM
ncbi:MAG: Thiamine pyrophosphate-requiring enzymes [uncultured Thermomicrobiales bacterium]|uniref:Thiamine pyrophosphate-requiring enzymes n=1 Tax=uncultured Thermomicrobiales bacterium TaxID=1645740 RepID=A0A6J4UKN8_9BACT|nr:MAG: Thiamine pyrophosphate-requiring enzymes [uncultured Thermomicrobiales bacterium]